MYGGQRLVQNVERLIHLGLHCLQVPGKGASIQSIKKLCGRGGGGGGGAEKVALSPTTTQLQQRPCESKIRKST